MTATSSPAYQGVAPWIVNESQHRRDMARTINALLIGKMNVTKDVTLRASQTTTVITDARIGYTTAVVPAMPMTVNGAVALDSGIWCNPTVNGSATVHHAASVATDQTIRFLLIG